MIDPLGREITHLRMSLTRRCNLDCFYCHGEGNSDADEMPLALVRKRLEEAREEGIKSVKFTGGEPLLRDDILDIIRHAKKLGFDDISMTTNGTLVGQMAGELKSVGLERVNIGCDTISANLPKNLKRLKAHIIHARENGLGVKVNMVVMTVNQQEVPAMVAFCKRENVNLQLIELIDLGNRIYKEFHVSLSDIDKSLEVAAGSVIVRAMQNRKRYILGRMYVETVRPSQKFCEQCHKIRVAASGEIKPCLLRQESANSFSEANDRRLAYGYG